MSTSQQQQTTYGMFFLVLFITPLLTKYYVVFTTFLATTMKMNGPEIMPEGTFIGTVIHFQRVETMVMMNMRMRMT